MDEKKKKKYLVLNNSAYNLENNLISMQNKCSCIDIEFADAKDQKILNYSK